MARGKYLSLEGARKSGKLKQFTKEHSSISNERKFNKLFRMMAKKRSEGGQTRGLAFYAD